MARKPKTQKEPRTIAELAHLSASSIGLFETCPRQWASQYLYGAPRADSKELRAGTAVHSLHQGLFGQPVEGDPWKHISEKERPAVNEFLKYLESRRAVTRAVEYEARVYFMHGAPPILMYIDRLEISEDGQVLTIVDVKTNRRLESVAKWKEKIQIQIYQWAVRQLWPGQFREVRWRIEYALLGKQIEWVTDPKDDEVLVQRLKDAWMSLLEISRGRTSEVVPLDWFPETTHQFCPKCDQKDTCQTFQSATHEYNRDTETLLNLPQHTVGGAPTSPEKPAETENDVAKEVESPVDITDKAARYAAICETYKLVKGEKEALGAELKAHIAKNGDVGLPDGRSITLNITNQRTVSPLAFNTVVGALLQESDPMFIEAFNTVYDQLYEVRIGVIDSLSKVNPRFAKAVEEIIQVHTSVGNVKIT